MAMVELARLKKGEKVDLVISTVSRDGKLYLDLRDYVDLAGYKGFTRKGVRVPGELVPEFKAMVKGIKL